MAALVGGAGQIETGFLVTRNEEDEFGGMATARCSWHYKEFNVYAGLNGYSREYTIVPVTQYLEKMKAHTTRTACPSPPLICR